MKKWTFQEWGFVFALTMLPLVGGCDQQEANSAPVPEAVANQQPTGANAVTGTNPPAPEVVQENLAGAPGTVISTPSAAPAKNTSDNPQLNEVVKLAQAGVGENVLMAYVTNSPSAFNVSTDDIIYLNDLGVPENVVTALIQRDQFFKSNPGPAASAPTNSEPMPDAETYSADAAVTPPLTPSPNVIQDVEQAPNGSYSYFYDSLAPYGNWIDIEGYGPCWQPTVVVANPGWQPYCDRGHWVYTDCGWCWTSDYSWGWAPFHYGRWFQSGRFGWCWAPDTIWGPAWVSWRYSDAYCGWAPLPPTACYRPGFGFTYFGRSVGFNFTFGVSADCFVFLPLDHCHDRFPAQHRLPHREVTKIYNTTTINNTIIRGKNNTIINQGVPVERVAAAAHTEIRPVHIRADAGGPGSPRLERNGHSLSVYRPTLPAPSKPTAGTRLVGEGVRPDTHFNLRSRVNRTPATDNGNPGQQPFNNSRNSGLIERRPIVSNPSTVPQDQNRRENPEHNNRSSQPNNEKPTAPIWHSTPSAPAQTAPPNLRHGPVFQPQQPVDQTPAQPNTPANENRNHRIVTPPLQPQPDRPAVQNPEQPSFNNPGNESPRSGPRSDRQQRELLRPVTPTPRQETPPVYEVPREPRGNNNPGFGPAFRPEPVTPTAPPRVIESRPTPQMTPPAQSAPPQVAPPAQQQSHQEKSGGNNGNGQDKGDGKGNGRGNRGN